MPFFCTMAYVRVPYEVKARMSEIDLNWSGDIRKCIEMKLKTLELLKALKKVERDARKIRVKGDSTSLIREDRDSR